ncbi:MAG: hypothetical protein NVS2B3_17110 [Vulcanimicrobiaceae bacterium]
MNLRNLEADPDPVPRHSGLGLIRDIVVAPNRAFEQIAATRSWLPTYAAIVVASLIGTALYAPALLHIAAVTPPPPGVPLPTGAGALADADRRFVLAYAFGQALMPLALMLLTASALTTVARFKGIAAPYPLFLSLAAACMIPSVIGGLLSATIVRLHDPASFKDLRSLLVAVPTNLAVFSSPTNEREIAFLAHFDAFDIWTYVLLACGLVRLVPIRFATALVVAFGLDFLFAILF